MPNAATLSVYLAPCLGLWTFAIVARELGVRGIRRLGLVAAGIAALSAATTICKVSSIEAAAFIAIAALICTAICLVDADKRLIPDLLVLPLALVSCVSPLTSQWAEKAIGALVLGGTFLFTRIFYRGIRNQDGLGFGDVKLAAVIGALVGARIGLWVVVLASLATALYIVLRRTSPSAPFGVGLACATIGALLFAQPWSAS